MQKRQCAIWDTATLSGAVAPRSKCTAFKYANGSMCFGTQRLLSAGKRMSRSMLSTATGSKSGFPIWLKRAKSFPSVGSSSYAPRCLSTPSSTLSRIITNLNTASQHGWSGQRAASRRGNTPLTKWDMHVRKPPRKKKKKRKKEKGGHSGALR